jgi:7,8-dihydropterin-6-yl-methyl-4-(beta-D-ribofuranosyl)aminobenzene 5'-phosphate synthase
MRREPVREMGWVLMALAGLLFAGCRTLPRVPPASPTESELAVVPEVTAAPRATGTAGVTATPTVGGMATLTATRLSERTSTPRAATVPAFTSTLAPTRTNLPSTATPTEAFDRVTLTVLYDNNAYDERLQTAWGFSCLIQGPQETILFDTGGGDDLLLHNMQALGIDPGSVDIVVISHVHADHAGGLTGFLRRNPAVAVYLPQSFPEHIKNGAREVGAEVVQVREPVAIGTHVFSTGELGDAIKEQALVIETARGLLVITGCAHPGIVDVVRQAKELANKPVYLVLGGFHLSSAGGSEITAIVETFQQMGVQRVAPCHCSGELARKLFEEVYGKDLLLVGAGSRLVIGD